jgi:hypothetical protein
MVRKNIQCTFILLVLILLYSSTKGQARLDPVDFSRAGLSGWQFLHLPTNARSAALGGVKSGVLNQHTGAIFNNPARLVDVENIDASFTHINYIVDISYLTAAVAKNFGNWGIFGLSAASLDAGELIRTENLLTGGRSGDLGTFEAGDKLIGLSYARQVTERLAMGGTFSYIEETLDDVKANNWDLDFGVSFLSGFHTLRFDLVARNFGPDTRFVGFTEQYMEPASVRMPLDFFVGVGYDFIGGLNKKESAHTISSYLEMSHPNDNQERIHAALEYNYLGFFFLRGGYKFNYDEQGITLGFGLNYYTSGVIGRFDYAFLDYGRLESVHLFTLGFGVK